MSEEMADAIRCTHPYGFRSGEWAALRGIVPGNGELCYLVEFIDSVTDFWPVEDTAVGYEFRYPQETTP